MKYLKAILLLFMVISFTACSTTTETIKKVEETTTIQPVIVDVPEVRSKFDIPLIAEDTSEALPFGVYSGSQVVETTDSLTGKTSKANVDVKVTVKKNTKGKTTVTAEVKTQQAPIKTEAKVISSKTTTDSETKTEGFFTVIWNSIKWWLLLFFIIAIGLAIVFRKVVFPIAKKYIGLP